MYCCLFYHVYFIKLLSFYNIIFINIFSHKLNPHCFYIISMKVVRVFASASPQAKRHAPPWIQSVFFHVVILATGLCGLSVSLCVSVRERRIATFSPLIETQSRSWERAAPDPFWRFRRSNRTRVRSERIRWRILLWAGCDRARDWSLMSDCMIETFVHLQLETPVRWARLGGFALLRIGWICSQEGCWRHLSWFSLLYRFYCRCHVLEM